MNLDQVTLLAYFAAMLAIGLYFSRKHSGSESFLLAGRNLGQFHVTAASFSTFVGAGLGFFLASFGFRYGLSALVLILAALIGFLFFLRFSEEIHEKSSEKKSVTIPQLLEEHWDEKTRVLASIVIIILFAASIGSQFIVAGTILNQLFGFPPKASSAAFGVLVICYTFLGGFKSVTWSDILQMFLILFGMFFLLLPLSILNHWSEIQSLPASHVSEFSIPLPAFLAYLLITIFVYYGSQDLFQRIYAAERSENARKGLKVFGILMLALAAVSVLLGTFARAIVPQAQPGEALAALTDQVVPVGLTGPVLAAFISMANSSGDSQLLSLSSNILEDFIKKKRDLTQRQELITNRVLVVVIGSIALLTVILIPGLEEIFNSVASWLGILGFTVFLTLKWEIKDSAFHSLLLGFLSANIFAFHTGEFSASALVGIITSALTIAVFKLYTVQKDWRAF